MTDDKCPRCGETLEYDEVDIGVGVQRGNPGCPACYWTPKRRDLMNDEQQHAEDAADRASEITTAPPELEEQDRAADNAAANVALDGLGEEAE